MADNGYVKGKMDASGHEAMWAAFTASSSWVGLIIVMLVGYLTFTLAIGMNWAMALGITALGGLAIGLFMGFGSAWIATVVGLTGLAVIVSGVIAVYQILS